MKAWGHEVIEFEEKEAEKIFGQEIIACQIAEGGAMGYHGGVFLVSSAGDIYFTCLLEPSDWSGYNKYTPLHLLAEVFPPLKEFESGLMGHGVSSPNGFQHEYLGMGNHLLIKEEIYKEFQSISSARLGEHPERILYNVWLDAILDVLEEKKHPG